MVGLGRATLWLHVGAGVVALAAGLGALLSAKGGPTHRRVGRWFVYSMSVVVVTAVVLFGFEPSELRAFLALVAVFSGYLAFSGYRVLSRKRPTDGPERVDWAAAGAVVLACLALGGWGLVLVVTGDAFGVVMLVFGAIGLAMGGLDVRTFRASGSNGDWLVTHLQRMLAAFVATVSAVSAVNLTGTLGIAAWLWPTVVGVPLIAYLSNEYERS